MVGDNTGIRSVLHFFLPIFINVSYFFLFLLLFILFLLRFGWGCAVVFLFFVFVSFHDILLAFNCLYSRFLFIMATAIIFYFILLFLMTKINVIGVITLLILIATTNS